MLFWSQLDTNSKDLLMLDINASVLCFWGSKAHKAVCLGNSREVGEASLTLTPT